MHTRGISKVLWETFQPDGGDCFHDSYKAEYVGHNEYFQKVWKVFVCNFRLFTQYFALEISLYSYKKLYYTSELRYYWHNSHIMLGIVSTRVLYCLIYKRYCEKKWISPYSNFKPI